MTFAELKYYGLIGYWGDKAGMHIAVWLLGFLVCAVIAYLLGSLNFAIIISKNKFKQDIREFGSGNAGMTNMLRTYGKAAAAFTFLGDGIKAALSVVIGMMLNGMVGGYIAGFFCILGHMFPIYYKFKGGKGVVTTAIMVLILDWRVFSILFIVFLIVVVFTKFVSLGSILSMLLYPMVLYNFNRAAPDLRIVIALMIAGLVIFMHRGNIKRLMSHTERQISFKKKPKPVQVPENVSGDDSEADGK